MREKLSSGDLRGGRGRRPRHAGSVLTLDRAVTNFTAFTGAPLATVARLATANPAALSGFAATHGAIAPGRRG